MSTQLTLQAPLVLPPAEVPGYLERLWSDELGSSHGAATFTLVVWEGSWLEQQLVRCGRLDGPITGLLNETVLEAARAAALSCGLPLSTAPMDPQLAWAIGNLGGDHHAADLRGQFVEGAISVHMPRRLITLAPTLDGTGALRENLDLVQPLISPELPCWVWWNSSLDEAPEVMAALASGNRRLVVDSSLGDPRRCLDLLVARVGAGQPINDLNWMRLRSWRESLAMVFDPPSRRDALNHVVQLDLDVEGDNPVKGLLLAAWLADRLGWHLTATYAVDGDGSGQGIGAEFERTDGQTVRFRQMPVPVGVPKTHPGAMVGLRLICQSSQGSPLCVILCSESGGCMRLESGGMASMELAEEVVPLPNESEEMEMARLLSGGHDSTNPLLAVAAPIAARLLP